MRSHSTLLRPAARRALLVWLSALLGGCNPLDAFEPQVVADTQLFALQARNVGTTSGTAKYDWVNPEAQATVHHATTTVGGGAASIRILDATGTLVYSSSLEQELTQTTTTGVPGSWTIVVTMTGFSGTLGFHILAGVP